MIVIVIGLYMSSDTLTTCMGTKGKHCQNSDNKYSTMVFKGISNNTKVNWFGILIHCMSFIVLQLGTEMGNL